MIIVEDNKTYELRRVEEHLRQRDEYYRKRAAQVDPERQHILDIVHESDGDPIRITSVANQFARKTGHSWKPRAETVKLKKQALRIVGELINGFYLERFNRKWVRWVPPDNPRRKAFEQRVDEMTRSFSKPNL
jgi:hypothetical protein